MDIESVVKKALLKLWMILANVYDSE